MDRATGNGALIMMHAENGIAIDAIVAAAIGRGQTDPIYHGLTRPVEMGGRGRHPEPYAWLEVTRAPLYIVHVSSAPALQESSRPGPPAKRLCRDLPAVPVLVREDMARPASQGGEVRVHATLRPREHQAVLWRGLRTDDLSVVATDHCPFCFAEQKELGVGDFTRSRMALRAWRIEWTSSSRVSFRARYRWLMGRGDSPPGEISASSLARDHRSRIRPDIVI